MGAIRGGDVHTVAGMRVEGMGVMLSLRKKCTNTRGRCNFSQKKIFFFFFSDFKLKLKNASARGLCENANMCGWVVWGWDCINPPSKNCNFFPLPPCVSLLSMHFAMGPRSTSRFFFIFFVKRGGHSKEDFFLFETEKIENKIQFDAGGTEREKIIKTHRMHFFRGIFRMKYACEGDGERIAGAVW